MMLRMQHKQDVVLALNDRSSSLGSHTHTPIVSHEPKVTRPSLAGISSFALLAKRDKETGIETVNCLATCGKAVAMTVHIMVIISRTGLR